ncbi:GntR family transcriptional regulator [Oceanobacillus longus]|uniref:GntR family transcriptional regulator n=1 Tax=Oceanobacillus longus TaxID=930120 RepID=A0ABV8GVA4_9BACI
MLDEYSVIPLYHQLKEIIREKIKGGYWKEQYKVPPERELMETYNVSRSTIRKALDELITEGLIYRKQGVGTFVSKSKIVHDLIGEISFNQQVMKKGLTPSSKVIYADVDRTSSKRIREIFQLIDSEEIYKIIRVRLVNDNPFILETIHIPYKYAPKILEQNLASIAFFDYLERELKFNFTHSTLDIEPIAINEFESNYLEVEIRNPALSLERVIYSGESAITIQRRIMRGDKGKFSFTLGENAEDRGNYISGLEFN